MTTTARTRRTTAGARVQWAAEAFAGNYDQGRVQRLIGFDESWTRMCVESAQEWPRLEQRTGNAVHDRVDVAGWTLLDDNAGEASIRDFLVQGRMVLNF